jgi:hypothetical protein
MMTLIPVTPPARSLSLAQSGDAAVCIVERDANGVETLVEVRGRVEAMALISALVVAFELPALPTSFRPCSRAEVG